MKKISFALPLGHGRTAAVLMTASPRLSQTFLPPLIRWADTSPLTSPQVCCHSSETV